jgi:tRNA 5-methylaminomethyl-2-thiouridine biosynthesis bifunctional protein
MPRLPPSPNITFNDVGLIHGVDFGDSYFSRDDGLAETRAVFLAGNNLPEAWAKSQCFVIGELGFGTGLNVLAVWDLWRQTAPANAVLHIITVEGFLMEASDAKAALQKWPELAALSEKLIARWPTRAFGTQRIWLDDDRICLTFLIGPCEDVLSRADFKADCWFLDGFAPSKNPDMWSSAVFANIARLSQLGASLATYSVAGKVRAGLVDNGFDVSRVPGFGSKRERLEARFGADAIIESHVRPQTAIVIGGGIGGAALCKALSRRAVTTHLIDADPCGRTKASGNPMALIIPRLDKGDTREARFYRSAYLMAIDAYNQMDLDCFARVGAIEGGDDAVAKARLLDLLADPPLPPEHMIAGEDGTIGYLRSGIAYPDRVLEHLKGDATRHPVSIARIEEDGAGQWCAFDEHNAVVAKADMCVIAAGTGINLLHDFGTGLGGRAGQLSLAKLTGVLPKVPVSGAGYGAQFGDRLAFGATFEHWSLADQTPPPITAENHIYNRDVLAKIAPGLAGQIDLATASGRTSIRVTTSDQIPVAGPVPDNTTGLYVLAGLGSRGFTTAFLGAELIVAHACGEPSPVETSVMEALAPDRFAKRRAKRGT